MGSTSIGFEMSGKSDQKQIETEFLRLKERDAQNNGYRDGYSGDFQTVRKIKFTDLVFDTKKEAWEYCLNNAEKWESLVAVRFKVIPNLKTPKRIQALQERYRLLKSQSNEVYELLTTSAQKNISESRFVKCSQCKSRIAATAVDAEGETRKIGLTCPVCHSSFGKLSLRKKFNRIRTRLKSIEHIIGAILEKETKRAADKSKDTNWLVGGWGAC